MIITRPKAAPHSPAGPIECVNPNAFLLWPVAMFLTLLVACSKQPAETPKPPVEVTAITIVAKDTPVELEFGQVEKV